MYLNNTNCGTNCLVIVCNIRITWTLFFYINRNCFNLIRLITRGIKLYLYIFSYYIYTLTCLKTLVINNIMIIVCIEKIGFIIYISYYNMSKNKKIIFVLNFISMMIPTLNIPRTLFEQYYQYFRIFLLDCFYEKWCL